MLQFEVAAGSRSGVFRPTCLAPIDPELTFPLSSPGTVVTWRTIATGILHSSDRPASHRLLLKLLRSCLSIYASNPHPDLSDFKRVPLYRLYFADFVILSDQALGLGPCGLTSPGTLLLPFKDASLPHLVMILNVLGLISVKLNGSIIYAGYRDYKRLVYSPFQTFVNSSPHERAIAPKRQELIANFVRSIEDTVNAIAFTHRSDPQVYVVIPPNPSDRLYLDAVNALFPSSETTGKTPNRSRKLGVAILLETPPFFPSPRLRVGNDWRITDVPLFLYHLETYLQRRFKLTSSELELILTPVSAYNLHSLGELCRSAEVPELDGLRIKYASLPKGSLQGAALLVQIPPLKAAAEKLFSEELDSLSEDFVFPVGPLFDSVKFQDAPASGMTEADLMVLDDLQRARDMSRSTEGYSDYPLIDPPCPLEYPTSLLAQVVRRLVSDAARLADESVLIGILQWPVFDPEFWSNFLVGEKDEFSISLFDKLYAPIFQPEWIEYWVPEIHPRFSVSSGEERQQMAIQVKEITLGSLAALLIVFGPSALDGGLSSVSRRSSPDSR